MKFGVILILIGTLTALFGGALSGGYFVPQEHATSIAVTGLQIVAGGIAVIVLSGIALMVRAKRARRSAMQSSPLKEMLESSQRQD